jgi:ribulose-phosphate 3-epimerase
MKCIKTKLPLDVHLMVSNPAERIEEFLEAGASHITFHAEAVKSTSERRAIIRAIRKGKATAGIAINPATHLKAIEDVVRDIDLVLVMSVVPGFSGQKFMKAVLPKVIALRARFPKLMIQMDGGIDAKNAGLCKFAGATNLVAASAIFNARDRKKAINAIRNAS